MKKREEAREPINVGFFFPFVFVERKWKERKGKEREEKANVVAAESRAFPLPPSITHVNL